MAVHKKFTGSRKQNNKFKNVYVYFLRSQNLKSKKEKKRKN